MNFRTFLLAIVFLFFVGAFRVLTAHADHPLCQILLNREEGGESELVMTARGEYAGKYRYRMTGESTAYVTGMFMHPTHKGKHLSKIFVYAMLQRHPKITTVGALLVMDNLAASGLLWAPKNISQEQCIFGASQTPFAKAFAHYGFSIKRCRWNPDAAYLQVEASK